MFENLKKHPEVIVENLSIFIGMRTKAGIPWCKLSTENFSSWSEAEIALASSTWTVANLPILRPLLTHLVNEHIIPPFAMYGTFYRNMQ